MSGATEPTTDMNLRLVMAPVEEIVWDTVTGG
jgi:hypothetical protein